MGYTQSELDDVQAKWDLRFPPDLIELLRHRRPLINNESCFDWITADPRLIAERLAWPFESYLFSLEEGGHWWPEWGDRAASPVDRRNQLHAIFAQAPPLIPLSGHRYIPQEPLEIGNPVFSVYGADIIHYGADLRDWIERECAGWIVKPWPPIKEIRFWSDAVRYFSGGPRTHVP